MIKLMAFTAAFAVMVAAGPAAATNQITIDPTVAANNVLTLDVAGSQNALVISQTAPAGTASPNQMLVSISGDENGGSSDTFSGAALLSGLTPGHLSQSGEGNMMALSVTGSGNLFAMAQTGSFNSVAGTIQGQNNQAAVVQVGTGNHLSFSQVGNGNIINISQTSW